MSRSQVWIIGFSVLAVIVGAWAHFSNAPKSPAVDTLSNPISQTEERKPVTATPRNNSDSPGCDANSHIELGKQIEPRATPDQPVSAFRKVYGKESKRNEFGPLTWNFPGYSITDGYFNKSKASDFVSISVRPSHTLSTVDGVELGVDTFATVLKKLRAKGIEVEESMDGPEGNWMLYVSFSSPCSRNFRGDYSWFMAGSPKTDRQIIPEMKGSVYQSPTWRSDVFLNKVVYDYTLSRSNGNDIPVGNQPSTHK